MSRPLVLLAALGLLAGPTYSQTAQQQTAAQQAGAQTAAQPPTPAPAPKQPVVLTLQTAQCRDANLKPQLCELGDTLYVGVANLQDWMKDAPDKNKPTDLVLVLNGRIMKGLTARCPDTSYKELAFDLKMTGDPSDPQSNRADWKALLSRSKSQPDLTVAVALGGNPPCFGPATMQFQVFPTYSWLIVAFLVALLLVFLVMAYKSDIVRDAPSDPAGPKMSFSLARCQMAFWFFVVVASYNYIWMVTGDYDSVTQGAVILIGISAATGLGSTVVDASKRDQRLSLTNERVSLQARLSVLQIAIATIPAPASLADLLAEQAQKTARLAEVVSSLASLPSPPDVSQGFLVDILRDETGVSFHRFQMAAWTVVLGFVFAIGVYKSLAMPDFSATLLGLMGISSGTYIGFKIPDPPK